MAEGKIPRQLTVYHENLVGTADAYGRVLTNFNIADKRVVGLLSAANGQCVIQLRLSGNTLGVKIVESTAMNPVAQGTSCSFNVFYVYI